MTFHIGQKVVCVDAENPCRCGCACGLSKGVVYTIAKVFYVFGACGVQLVETAPVGWIEVYAANRFRPIVERETDIGVFKEMLAAADTTLEPAA